MLMQATAHEGCMDTIRESALEADSERILCHTGAQTHTGFMPGFSVRRSTNWAVPGPRLRQARSLDSCIPDSIAEFADDITQTEETLVDGTALPKTITRILCSLLGTRQINKVLQSNHSFHKVTKLLFLIEAVRYFPRAVTYGYRNLTSFSMGDFSQSIVKIRLFFCVCLFFVFLLRRLTKTHT